MSTEQAVAFLIFATVAAITPGPSNAMLTVTGAAVGIARGFPCLFGVASGMAAMMFLAACGLGAVVAGAPALLTALKVAGATFLLWLAWKIGSAPPGDLGAQGRPVSFLEAFGFQWLNPKSWLVSTSAAGTYLQAQAHVLVQGAWIAGLFFVVALATGFVWLGFGTAVRRLLASRRLQRAFNVTMGVLLAASVLLFLR